MPVLKNTNPVETREQIEGRNNQVLAYVTSQHPCTVTEIATGLSVPSTSVSRACCRLVKAGKLTRVGRLYSPSNGQAASSSPPERHIPGRMGVAKHWSQEIYIPPERLAPFKLPSIVNGQRVYPKGVNHER